MQNSTKLANNDPSLKENIAIVKVIKDNLIEIKTSMYNKDNTDLDLLYKHIKNKDIIGFGEATHGTKEFQNMRTRVIVYLIEKLNFRTILLEESYIQCLRINSYILEGRGTADGAVRQGLLFPWVFKTEETVLSVKLLREYNNNADKNNKVRFYGMDMQGANKVAQALELYIKKVDVELFNDKIKLNILKENIFSIKEVFIKNKINYIKNSSEREFSEVYHCFEVYNQWLEYSGDMTFNKRDRFMYENAKWIIENGKKYNDKKTIIAGHNDHIQKGKLINLFENKQLGYWLDDNYKEKYYNIGFEFSRGMVNSMDINTRELKVYKVDKSIKNDLAVRLFEETNIPMFYLDLNATAHESYDFKNFISTVNRYNAIGAVYDERNKNFGIDNVIIKNMYDAILYIRDSSSTTICET
ncbi:erythromycin esterase family protein [Clostridium estertheticum]|uniref:erythromycin esterase family protein n=1 Tax=Clostridium estertheticum TaxID=238834 RepID=UPI001C0B6E4C|nr:erythromycin esterase family protein [Clostridium estertheticum]MBU3202125.1 erythromycin esterase family protein [Clostridium estertheticum]WAG64767.1 erythromycin esterase family protein [Clostridium estertheticum]